MNPSLILAVAFNVLSLASLLFFVFAKLTSDIAKYRNYLIASSAVYFSATLLITVIIFLGRKIPPVYTVISEVMILFIYAVVIFVLIKSIRTIQEIKEQAEAGNMRSAEEVKAEDEAFYGTGDKEEELEE